MGAPVARLVAYASLPMGSVARIIDAYDGWAQERSHHTPLRLVATGGVEATRPWNPNNVAEMSAAYPGVGDHGWKAPIPCPRMAWPLPSHHVSKGAADGLMPRRAK